MSSAPAVSASTAKSAPSQHLVHDPSLVHFPPGVEACRVYRNVISDYDEELIIEELSRILPKEGQSYYADPSRINDKILRNIYLELFGHRDFTESKNWRQKKGQERIPGLGWSPTLLDKVVHGLGRGLLGRNGDGEEVVADAARVVEHHLPGYEMHTEHPTVGRSFLYLNLMSDTVLMFDDEATQRQGSVYLPQRSLMVCSGEVRWGWRFGESSSLGKSFTGINGLRKRLSEEPEMRLSIQLWKFDPNLVDRRQLQDDLERALAEAKEKSAALQAERVAKEAAEKNGEVEEEPKLTFTLPPRLKQQLMEGAANPYQSGKDSAALTRLPKSGVPKVGSLGGDYVAPESITKTKKTIPDLEKDMNVYRKSISNVQTIMKQMRAKQDAHEPVTTEWLQEQAASVRDHKASELDTDYEFDPSNPEQAWDEVDRKAREYKQKIKSMNYDGDSNREAKAFDLGFDPEVEAPLDIKELVKNLVPHIKDGETIFAENDFGNLRGRR